MKENRTSNPLSRREVLAAAAAAPPLSASILTADGATASAQVRQPTARSSSGGPVIRSSQIDLNDGIWLDKMGADPSGETPCDNVLNEAFDLLKNHAARNRRTYFYESVPILFGIGKYRFENTINLKMQTVLEGHTRGLMVDGKGAATALYFPTGKTGIIINRHDTLNEHDVVADGGSAASSILRGLGIFSRGFASRGVDRVRGSGVLARAMMEIDRCAIDGFSNHGVAIVANVADGNGGSKGEASECRVLNSQINQNRNHGIYLAGSDVNIASIKNCRIGYNGGWGILNLDAGPCYTESIHYVSNGKAGAAGQAATSMVYNNRRLYGLRMTSDPRVGNQRGNGPPNDRSDNADWIYLRDISSAPPDGPQWISGMELRNGGAGWLRAVGSVAMAPYLEGTQNGLWVNRGHEWSAVPVIGPRFEATRVLVYTP